MGVTEVRYLIRHWRLLSSAVPLDAPAGPSPASSPADAPPGPASPPGKRENPSGDRTSRPSPSCPERRP